MARKPVSDSDFFTAVSTRDSPLVRRLIASRRDVNVRGERRRTPLHVCVWEDNVEAARLLLEAGADINAYDDLHDTPFLLCGAEGRVEIMRYMLKYAKPDLSRCNEYGASALTPACERGHTEMVKLLLGYGLDANHVSDLGLTGLLEVVILGGDDLDHVEITKALIAAGADVNLSNKDGRTPLYLARKYKMKRIAKLLEDAGGHI